MWSPCLDLPFPEIDLIKIPLRGDLFMMLDVIILLCRGRIFWSAAAPCVVRRLACACA
jgi:hypothetical protein